MAVAADSVASGTDGEGAASVAGGRAAVAAGSLVAVKAGVGVTTVTGVETVPQAPRRKRPINAKPTEIRQVENRLVKIGRDRSSFWGIEIVLLIRFT